jgi:hypothetical protein
VVLVDAVSGVSASRLGDVVRLRWEWPRGAGRARVRWRPLEQPVRAGRSNDRRDPRASGQADVQLRRYIDDGGAEITVGPGPVAVAVRTVVTVDGVETESPATVVEVAGRQVEVAYSVTTSRLRKRVVVTLVPDESCQLPPIVVVGRSDGILPLSAARGTVVATLPAREAVAGRPKVEPLAVSWPDAASLACFVDPAAADSRYARVTLVRSRGDLARSADARTGRPPPGRAR